MATANNIYEEVADRIVQKVAPVIGMVPLSFNAKDHVRNAVIELLKEVNDVPLADVAAAKALAERDGRSWIFDADAGPFGDILRGNYLSDARYLIEKVNKALGKVKK